MLNFVEVIWYVAGLINILLNLPEEKISTLKFCADVQQMWQEKEYQNLRDNKGGKKVHNLHCLGDLCKTMKG